MAESPGHYKYMSVPTKTTKKNTSKEPILLAMAEEFQAEICGGTWWNSSGSVLIGGGLPSCSTWNANDHIYPRSPCNYATDHVLFRNSHKHQSTVDSDYYGALMGFELSSPENWNQSLIDLQEDTNPGLISEQDSRMQLTNQGFFIEHQRLHNSDISNTSCYTSTNEAFSMETSKSIQSLFEEQHDQQVNFLFNNQLMNYSSMTTNNYEENLTEEFSPFWSKALSSSPKPAFSSASPISSNNTRESLLPSLIRTQPAMSSFEDMKINASDLKSISSIESKVQDSKMTIKKENEPALKRPRIHTPLPTFKVRKEKLGDRVTALQQLVSPFGKTDTASVLQEAVEYIKFLHDQVNALSTPYMKKPNRVQRQQKVFHEFKDQEGPKEDLRSRGLCLLPISSTFPIAHETPSDFWTPNFGATFNQNPS